MSIHITYPLTIFYDGACKVCVRQMSEYKRKDKERRLRFLDIRVKDFRASDYGLDSKLLERYLWAKDSKGREAYGAEAFSWIWTACGYRFLPFLFTLPIVSHIAKACYRIFSRYRYAFGKKREWNVCEGACSWKNL